MEINAQAIAHRRVSTVTDHLQPREDRAPMLSMMQTSASSPAKSDDDVVIVAAVRTPIGKAGRGSFKDTHWTELLAVVLEDVCKRGRIDPKEVDDIQCGTVLAPGGGATQARLAMFFAKYPHTTSITTLNRQCSSGLQAFANTAAAIQAGMIDIGIACGVESMSSHDMMSAVGELSDRVGTDSNPNVADSLLPMGITSENVAEHYGITRQMQDEFAVLSQKRAADAQKSGRFDEEIVPVRTTIQTPDGATKEIVVSKDDGVRPTTMETLGRLRPAFKKNGTSTPGNSSQTSDGAAAVLVMKRKEAVRRGLPILGRFRSFAVVGVPPKEMGIGPAFAIPPSVEKAGLKLSDIDIFEINEAFASQAVYCVNKLGIPIEKVNPNGGAIALGHPLGCTGARQIATLLYQLRREKKKLGVVSMCIGTGMGASGVFEAEY